MRFDGFAEMDAERSSAGGQEERGGFRQFLPPRPGGEGPGDAGSG